MIRIRIAAVTLLIAGALLGLFIYFTQQPGSSYPFKLGLDLNGGTHLEYQADVSKVQDGDIRGAMSTLRTVIERRINIFGVSEPLVQTEEATINGQKVEKLIVELPGVTDINQAIQLIGQTPTLQFKIYKGTGSSTPSNLDLSSTSTVNSQFEDTKLTGQYLQKATLEFNPQTNQPLVGLTFNSEGKQLFADITKANVGNIVGIFLDNQPISTPVVNEPILTGQAQISGNFTRQQAQDLVRNLNYGALPVPISLIGTESIGASLGADALAKSINAGIWGFIIVALFLILWYRLPGLLAVVSLGMYTLIMLTIFKLIPVVLTSAGLAGFILSIGMAVDANILIFERMKEEFRRGLSLEEGIREGFKRAWLSIRDSNLSSIITGLILYYFATSALVKGFALVFFIGVIVSMFTAITVSRTFLIAIGPKEGGKLSDFLFHRSFGKSKNLPPSNNL
ncbi:MAG TPA: protein translocase subunit SecD [Candidatus Paceibacterota bacterium]|nr:protein translocase subunit SecD [Candidatus Paceibacterota bacterium]